MSPLLIGLLISTILASFIIIYDRLHSDAERYLESGVHQLGEPYPWFVRFVFWTHAIETRRKEYVLVEHHSWLGGLIEYSGRETGMIKITRTK